MTTVHRLVRLAAAALTALIVAAPLAAPSAALGQFRMGGPGGGGGAISKRSLEKYEQVLGLDEGQKEAAAALHDAYTQTARQTAEEMREEMRTFESGAHDGDFSVIQEKLPAVMKKYGEKSAAMEKSFLDDLKSLLTPQQTDNWARLERLRRRESGLRFGQVSGASVDLLSMVDALKLTPEQRTPVADTLDQYEMDMDRLLQDREHDAKQDAGSVESALAFDMEAIQDRMKQEREAGLKVRDMNQRYARLISPLLPEDIRAKFDEEVQKKTFRAIYRESHATRSLNAAGKFDDLTDSQRERLRQIQENYQHQLPALNQRWAEALQQAETEGKAGGGMMFFGGGGGGQQSEELAAARKARNELDDKATAELGELLNDDQQARLPKRRQGPMFGGFDGGEFEFEGDGGDHVMVFATVDGADMGDGEGEAVVQRVIVSGGGEGEGQDQSSGPPPNRRKPPAPPKPAEPPAQPPP